MKPIFKKLIICLLTALCCSTLFLTWEGYVGVKMVRGIPVLSGNPLLTIIIFGVFFVSIFFYEKKPKLFFTTGLCSLSMLLTLFFRKFEIMGGFKNPFIGPWLGVLSVIIDLIVFILLFRPAKD